MTGRDKLVASTYAQRGDRRQGIDGHAQGEVLVGLTDSEKNHQPAEPRVRPGSKYHLTTGRHAAALVLRLPRGCRAMSCRRAREEMLGRCSKIRACLLVEHGASRI